jgi:Raf kinase inhibitor-like YbhB/YbcL family protein
VAVVILQSTFKDCDEIPKKHGYKQSNSSPPLRIKDVPPGTKSLVLIMDDPDAMGAVGKLWVHWVVWNIDPKTSEIAESSVPADALEGTTDFGEIGYGGPAPPDKRHTYVFKLYALNSKLALQSGASKRQIEDAMRDHIIAQTSLCGTFTP